MVWLVWVPETQARKFTNSAGQVIEVELVGGTKETVTLKLPGDREVTARVALFSKEDQAYIADWLKFYHRGKEVGEFKSADPALKSAVWK